MPRGAAPEEQRGKLFLPGPMLATASLGGMNQAPSAKYPLPSADCSWCYISRALGQVKGGSRGHGAACISMVALVGHRDQKQSPLWTVWLEDGTGQRLGY